MKWIKHNLCYLWRAHSKLAKPFNYARIVHKMQRLAYFLSLYSLFSTVGQQQYPNTEKPVRAEHVIFLQRFNIVHLSSTEFVPSTFAAVSYTLTCCDAYFIFVRGRRKKIPFGLIWTVKTAAASLWESSSLWSKPCLAGLPLSPVNAGGLLRDWFAAGCCDFSASDAPGPAVVFIAGLGWWLHVVSSLSSILS